MTKKVKRYESTISVEWDLGEYQIRGKLRYDNYSISAASASEACSLFVEDEWETISKHLGDDISERLSHSSPVVLAIESEEVGDFGPSMDDRRDGHLLVGEAI